MADARARYVLEAEDRTKVAIASAQANFKRLEAGAVRLGTVLGALGGALVLGQAARFTKDTLAMAQAIGDTAEKAGLTAEQLQVLRFAADQNGSSAQALDKAMIRLNVSIGEAGRVALGLEDRVSLAGEALTALGVDVLDAGGKMRTSADLFPQLIDALAAVESPAERAALAAQIFGKRIGPELAVLINQGSGPLEAYRQKLIETGALISNEVVQSSRELADQIARIGPLVVANFQSGFLKTFAGDYKDLEEAIKDPAFVKHVSELGQQLGNLFKGFIEAAPTALKYLRDIETVSTSIATAWLLQKGGVPLPVGLAIGAGANAINAETTPDTRDSTLNKAGIQGLSINDARKRTGEFDAEQAKRTRAAIKATRDIAAATQQRLAVETDAASRSIKISENLTKSLKLALEQQKDAYRDATQAVADALREREQIEKEFADLTQKPGGETSAQVTLKSFAAQRALTAGDPKEALRLAREAADAMRALQASGDTSASLQLTGKRLQQVAKDAAQGQLDQAKQLQAQVQQIQATFQGLLDQAKALETLKVGFDDEAAIAEATNLRASIEKALAENPITIPVKVASPGTDAAADAEPIPGRAGGGLIPGRSPHPRADNVLIRATAGEWMIQQPSARYYGSALMQAINQRLISREALAGALQQKPPGYAFGGPIADILTNNVRPRPNLSALAGNGGLPNAPTTTINLTLPTGQTYTVRADTDTAQALQRDIRLQALKSGKR